MNATITLDQKTAFEIKRGFKGETIITIPLDVLKRAYCDTVTEEMMRARQVAQPKGEPHEGTQAH